MCGNNLVKLHFPRPPLKKIIRLSKKANDHQQLCQQEWKKQDCIIKYPEWQERDSIELISSEGDRRENKRQATWEHFCQQNTETLKGTKQMSTNSKMQEAMVSKQQILHGNCGMLEEKHNKESLKRPWKSGDRGQ